MSSPSRCLVASCAGHPSSTAAAGSFFGSWAARAGPCPPAWHHPPLVSRRAGVVLGATFAAYLALSTILSLGCEAIGWSDARSGSGSVASLYLHLALLCSMGYVLVSLHMRRPLLHALACCSRYGGAGEWKKLQLVLPWLLLTGMLFLLRAPTASEQASGVFLSSYDLLFPSTASASAASSSASTTTSTGLILLPQLPWSFVCAFFLGCHFTFLDGSSTLQSLGCKLPLPSLWPELTRKELAVTLAATLAIIASLVPTIVFLLRGDEHPASILASLAVLACVVVYLADMHHTGNGTISSTAGGGGNGLEAPLSGRDMWRTKIGQILKATTVAGSTGTSSPSPAVAAVDLATSSASEIRPLVPIVASPSTPSAATTMTATTPSPDIFLHVHHYLWGLFLLPLLRFPSFSTTVAAGVCLGLAVEGIACWGMDPLLVCKRPIEPTRSRRTGGAATAATTVAAAATMTQATATTGTLSGVSQLQPTRLL